MPARKNTGTGSDGPVAKSKTSADYVREMRQRLKDAGLIKREFWILPENVSALQGIEKQLRQPFLGERVKLERFMTTSGNWTIETLRQALYELDIVADGRIGIGEADAASITLTMAEHGDLPIFIGVSGDQILVDTTLIEASKVKDINVFNSLVLRSRDLFPLSSVGVETIDGTDVYCMFGALSAASELTVIVHEVLALAENVMRAVDAYEDHFTI